MNKKLSIPTLIVLSIGLLAFYVADRVSAASEQQKTARDSVDGLRARVDRLEAKIADLQAQLNRLSAKQTPGVLALPGTHVFPGNQIPPGASQHEIGGIKYWTIPLGEGH